MARPCRRVDGITNAKNIESSAYRFRDGWLCAGPGLSTLNCVLPSLNGKSQFGMFRLLKSIVRHPLRWVEVLSSFRARPGRADVERWSDLSNFATAWERRSRHLADRVASGAAVIEFGCGTGALQRMLPQRVNYVGSDIVARSSDTLVWDLNGGAPPLDSDFDVAIFSGVLEYVVDVPAVVRQLRPRVRSILTSYASTDEVSDPLTRRYNGWINDFTRDQFVALFRSAGFIEVWRREWDDSSMFEFLRDG